MARRPRREKPPGGAAPACGEAGSGRTSGPRQAPTPTLSGACRDGPERGTTTARATRVRRQLLWPVVLPHLRMLPGLPQKDRTGVSGRRARLQGHRPGVRQDHLPWRRTVRVVQVDSGSVRVGLTPCVLRGRRPDRSFWSVVGFFRLRFPTTIEAVGACAKPRLRGFASSCGRVLCVHRSGSVHSRGAGPPASERPYPRLRSKSQTSGPSSRAFDGITSVETDSGASLRRTGRHRLRPSRPCSRRHPRSASRNGSGVMQSGRRRGDDGRPSAASP